jgi:excisionase family DNA binding protein
MSTSPLERTLPFEQLPEFLTPDEFRSYMGLGRNTVYDLLRRNDVPHVRLGRAIRIPKTALQNLRHQDTVAELR